MEKSEAALQFRLESIPIIFNTYKCEYRLANAKLGYKYPRIPSGELKKIVSHAYHHKLDRQIYPFSHLSLFEFAKMRAVERQGYGPDVSLVLVRHASGFLDASHATRREL
jgi:hypothetical protein